MIYLKRIVSVALMALMLLTLVSCTLRPIDENILPETEPANAETNDNSESESETERETETEPVTEPVEDVITKASFVGCGDNIIYYGTYRDAKSQAEAILLDANNQAEETKTKADKWAGEIRSAAAEFVEDIMKNSDEVLSSNIAEIRKARQSLFGDRR